MDFINIRLGDTEFEVSTDYYMEEGIRIPMGMDKAQEVLKQYNATFPTKEQVDAIWQAADLKLNPQPMPPTNQMSSKDYYERHNRMIEEQIGNRCFTLVAGHKKDIIQPRRAGRVTIYGWHRSTGRPIQPPSSVHGAYYFDYSHGLRLVRNK
jgi:hypothetical protein